MMFVPLERVCGMSFQDFGFLTYFEAMSEACRFVIGSACVNTTQANIVITENNVFVCLFILYFIESLFGHS